MTKLRTQSLLLVGACLSLASAARAEPSGLPPDASEAPPAADRVDRDRDDGRREVEWAYVRSSVGYTALDLTTFQASDDERLTAELIPSRMSGSVLGLAAGARLLFISLGLRGDVAFFSDEADARTVGNLELWSLNAEAMLHLLSGYDLEPYILLSAGYSAFAGVDDALNGMDDYRVRGFNARLGVGLDYFLSDDVSIGAQLSGGGYFLTRPGVSSSDLLQPESVETVGEARARVLEADGSSAGFGFALAVGPSVHF